MLTVQPVQGDGRFHGAGAVPGGLSIRPSLCNDRRRGAGSGGWDGGIWGLKAVCTSSQAGSWSSSHR